MSLTCVHTKRRFAQSPFPRVLRIAITHNGCTRGARSFRALARASILQPIRAYTHNVRIFSTDCAVDLARQQLSSRQNNYIYSLLRSFGGNYIARLLTRAADRSANLSRIPAFWSRGTRDARVREPAYNNLRNRYTGTHTDVCLVHLGRNPVHSRDKPRIHFSDNFYLARGEKSSARVHHMRLYLAYICCCISAKRETNLYIQSTQSSALYSRQEKYERERFSLWSCARITSCAAMTAARRLKDRERAKEREREIQTHPYRIKHADTESGRALLVYRLVCTPRGAARLDASNVLSSLYTGIHHYIQRAAERTYTTENTLADAVARYRIVSGRCCELATHAYIAHTKINECTRVEREREISYASLYVYNKWAVEIRRLAAAAPIERLLKTKIRMNYPIECINGKFISVPRERFTAFYISCILTTKSNEQQQQQQTLDDCIVVYTYALVYIKARMYIIHGLARNKERPSFNFPRVRRWWRASSLCLCVHLHIGVNNKKNSRLAPGAMYTLIKSCTRKRKSKSITGVHCALIPLSSAARRCVKNPTHPRRYILLKKMPNFQGKDTRAEQRPLENQEAVSRLLLTFDPGSRTKQRETEDMPKPTCCGVLVWRFCTPIAILATELAPLYPTNYTRRRRRRPATTRSKHRSYIRIARVYIRHTVMMYQGGLLHSVNQGTRMYACESSVIATTPVTTTTTTETKDDSSPVEEQQPDQQPEQGNANSTATAAASTTEAEDKQQDKSACTRSISSSSTACARVRWQGVSAPLF
ncbi:unnamed protein product [Trichogramma brassicae]|uniref:Uncharacterized protein n=1 Tax=Trichogramma brassicae TaxID=86971 RepID=A0A6H5HUA5_9HYME|nr:unnamed protein product [Trichogramma brassicae]